MIQKFDPMPAELRQTLATLPALVPGFRSAANAVVALARPMATRSIALPIARESLSTTLAALDGLCQPFRIALAEVDALAKEVAE